MDDIKPPAKPKQDEQDSKPEQTAPPLQDVQPANSQPTNQPPVGGKPVVQDVKPPTPPQEEQESDAPPTEPKTPPSYAAGGDDDASKPDEQAADDPKDKKAGKKDSQPEISEDPVVPKPKTAKLPIFLAFLVAIGLAGLTVWAYMNSSMSGAPENSSQETLQEEKEPATDSDVQETTESVDEAVESADEATQFNEDDLSDESLGL